MRRTFLSNRRSAYIMAFLAACVTAAIISYPEESFKASINGLRVWWEIVFPALLPFFIAAEILMALGVVHCMGALLEPLMRPLFDVPGVGAFALAMGLASGYPMGAKITGRLRRDNLCNQIEAERLLSFTNTADPLFMVGAVGVGMFGSEPIGFTIAAAHYISSIALGVLMRLHAPARSQKQVLPPLRRESIFQRAINELYRARMADGRSFGQILGDSVRESVNTLLLIGGVIIMFSVIIRVLTIVGATRIIAGPLAWLLTPFGVDPSLVAAGVSGLFEITIGSELASKAAGSLLARTMMASAVIAWSGLSVLAQVSSMVEGTDVRLLPYIIARGVHALLAALTTVFLMGPMGRSVGLAIMPVMRLVTPLIGGPGILNYIVFLGIECAFIISAMLITSLSAEIIRGIRIVTFRVRR